MSNIIYKIKETTTNNNINHGDIEKLVNENLQTMNTNNFDTILSNQLYYEDNYTKVDLEMIAGYYDISKRKKRKFELVQDIVLFELNPENQHIAQKRKLMWFYISEIESDSYLNEFLIFK